MSRCFFAFAHFYAFLHILLLFFVTLSAEGGNNAPEREGILLP